MILEPVIRITSDGAWRVTDSTGGGFPATGAVRITELEAIDIPVFDIAGAIDIHFPGLVVQASLTEAVTAWLIEHGEVTDADVPAILAAANIVLADQVVAPYVPSTQPPYPLVLPPYPTGLPRFPDSNSSPDGHSIVSDGKVVSGGGP